MGGRRVFSGTPGAQATAFVGRRAEVAAVRRRFEEARVVTLTGPPGVGKTRLGLQAAEEMARGFPDGVWFVDLLTLTDPALLAREVAGVLGVGDATTHWAVEGLAQHIRDRAMLLVLDNCEHLIDACAVFVDSLTRQCRHVRFLATSRQSLGIRAETVMRVPPLPLPGEGTVAGEAVELLLRRAAAVAPGFGSDADLAAAAELCRRLDGIPLAIELAAGRLRTLTVEQVLERLEDRFDMVAARDASLPAHHRTLRATLAWSRDLADDDERVLWRRASVFATGFDIASAEAVCTGEGLPSERLLDALDGLVDKSILTATREGTAMRYRMLDTIRAYGAEMLRSSGEDRVVRERFVSYYADLCRHAWEGWTHASQPDWFRRLEVEHGNLRLVLDWASDNAVETGCAMAADMWLFWEARAHLTEGRRRLATLLERVPQESPVRPKALWVAGYLALGQSDVDAGRPLLEAALAAAAEAADDESSAYATQYLGLSHLFAGDVAAAAELFEQSFAMHERLGSRTADFVLTDLAVTVMLLDDLERAVGLYERALTMNADDGDPWTRAHAQWGLGVAAFLLGDIDRAEAAEKTALELSGRLAEGTGIALALEGLAWIAAARGDVERAARLQGAGLAIWESIPGELPPPLRTHAHRCEQRIVASVGSARSQRLRDQGRRLDRLAAVALGLERAVAPPAPTPGERHARERLTGEGPGDDRPVPVLTRREREVAVLVAEGLTDREIARRLVIGQRTAESHVQHILTKLGFRTRAQIAAWVTEALASRGGRRF